MSENREQKRKEQLLIDNGQLTMKRKNYFTRCHTDARRTIEHARHKDGGQEKSESDGSSRIGREKNS